MADLPTTSYAVLGLLAGGKMSRYDIAQLAEQSIANFWTIAKSQVYSELSRLEDLGLVKGKDVAQKALPDKRVYEMTALGRKALRGWLESPGYEGDRYRSGFLVKWFFSDSMDASKRSHLLDQYTQQARARLNALEGAVEYLSSIPEAKYMRETALLGLMVTRAVVEWTEEVREPGGSKRATRRARA